ncbi:MAG: hypothetical protein AAGF56_02850 [Pseudomonadota bacterium]
MGPVRRRLTIAAFLLTPAAAWAEACETERPGWDGVSVSAWDEFLFLLQTPIVLLLVVATALALRFRSEWGGLAAVVGWAIATFLVVGWADSTGFRAAAMAEGCIGSPALFIAVAGLVSVGVVLYTAPLPKRDKQ